MTLEALTAMLAPLAIALGHRMDVPTFKAYHKALDDIPAPLLQAAIDAATRMPRQPYEPKFPPPIKLREMAEACRRAVVAANPYRPGECCNFSGWAERDIDGVSRAVRCACYVEHQQHLTALGAGPALTLEPARPQLTAAEDGEFDPRAAQVGSD